MKLHSVCTEPQSPTRGPASGPAKVTNFNHELHDLTLGALRVPVLNGKEGETTVIPVVRAVSKRALKSDPVYIPLARVCDVVLLSDSHLAASDTKNHTQVRA